MMQNSQSKIRTGFGKLLDSKGLWMPLSYDKIDQLGLDAETLQKISFVVRKDKDRIVIEGFLDREQPSIVPSPGEAGN